MPNFRSIALRFLSSIPRSAEGDRTLPPHQLSGHRLVGYRPSGQFGQFGQAFTPIALAMSSFTIAAVVGLGPQGAIATTPDDAPASLLQTLDAIDAAANQGDLDTVMDYYSEDFSSSDGLDYDDLQETLTGLWERYSNLTYETELLSWEQDGDAIVAETITLVTGRPEISGRIFDFSATIESRQRFVGQEIIEQEVLSEETVLMSGSNPPTVRINLPSEVGIGQEFVFDAIVLEPLGESRILGAAIDEAVGVSGYLDPETVNLELLSAGGLFKIGQAPVTPGSRWISAVLVRDDGITMVTRRLQVVR